MAQRPGTRAGRLRAGRDEPAPPSAFELMRGPVDATAGASINEPERQPDSEDTGECVRRDRWHRLVTIGVIAGLMLGLVGVGVGVEALRKSKAAPLEPSAIVVYPSSGSHISGTAPLAVKAVGQKVTSVTFIATGGKLHDEQIAVASQSLVGWLSKWDTTTVSNATYRITAVAYNGAGRSGQSASVTVNVQN